MAFRIKIKPLEKRHFKDVNPINNELIIDETEGNLGVAKINEEDITYLSGSEKLKSDFESLKIRSDNITKLLPNVNLGSSTNIKSSEFSFDKALNNGDILAALQYVHDCYQPYITEDEEGNIIFDDDSLSIEKDLGDLLNKMYYADKSYDHQIRNALLTVYENSLMNANDVSLNKTTEMEDTIKLRRDLILIEIPKLIKLERKIDELEYKERLISKVYHEYFLKGIDRVLSQTELNDYKINCRKFVDYNNLDFNKFLQTEVSYSIIDNLLEAHGATPPTGYKYNYNITNRDLISTNGSSKSIIESNIVNGDEIHSPINYRNTYLLGSKTTENFENTVYNLNPIKDFVMSPSDRNYDGDSNLFSYTSYYKIIDDEYEDSNNNTKSHELKKYRKFKDDNNNRMINYLDQISLSTKEFLVPLNKDISPLIYNIVFDNSTGYRGELMYKTIKNTVSTDPNRNIDTEINDIWNKAFVRKTNNMVNSIGNLIYAFRNYQGKAYYTNRAADTKAIKTTTESNFLYNGKTVINLKNLPNQCLELVPSIQNKVIRYNKLRHEQNYFEEPVIREYLLNDKFNHFYEDIYFNKMTNNLDDGTYSINDTIFNIILKNNSDSVFRKEFFNYNLLDQHYNGYSPYNETNKDSNLPENLYKDTTVADYAKLFKDNFLDVVYMFQNMFTSGTTIKEVHDTKNEIYHSFVLYKITDWREVNPEPFDSNLIQEVYGLGFDKYNNENNDAKLYWYNNSSGNGATHNTNGNYVVNEDLEDDDKKLNKSVINSLGETISASFAIARTHYNSTDNKTYFKVIVKNFLVIKNKSNNDYVSTNLNIVIKDFTNPSNNYNITQNKNPKDENYFINNYEFSLNGEVNKIKIETILDYTDSEGYVNSEKDYSIDYSNTTKNWTEILNSFFGVNDLTISVSSDINKDKISLFHEDINYFYKTKEDREFEDYFKTNSNNGGNGG